MLKNDVEDVILRGLKNYTRTDYSQRPSDVFLCIGHIQYLYDEVKSLREDVKSLVVYCNRLEDELNEKLDK